MSPCRGFSKEKDIPCLIIPRVVLYIDSLSQVKMFINVPPAVMFFLLPIWTITKNGLSFCAALSLISLFTHP